MTTQCTNRSSAGLLLAALLLCLGSFTASFAQQKIRRENHVYPANANLLDVTKAPFNADKTGATDATNAIQAALDSAGKSSANLIYLPDGTYTISRTLEWKVRQTRDVLEGQSVAGTIIRLADAAPGYTDPAATKAMIFTGVAPAQRFRNGIRNLTVSTGRNNPGASGIRFMANNQGGMDNVLIRSEDGQGITGLDLGYSPEQGPCLIKNVVVVGFNTGIRTQGDVNSITFVDVEVQNQRVVGLLNDGQVISLENFCSTGDVPALVNRGSGIATLVGATLRGNGNAINTSAIINTRGLLARDITTSGFKQAIDNSALNNGRTAPGLRVSEFSSMPVTSLFPSPEKTLNLPIKTTPTVPWDDPATWESVANYAPKDTTLTLSSGRRVTVKDWTSAIQQAIDAGKTTIYFPSGKEYNFVGTIYIRGNVRRIFGLEAGSNALDKQGGGFHHGTWVVADGTAPVVVLERFDSVYARWAFVHQSNRAFVLKNLPIEEVTVKTGAGDLFIEDVVGGYVTVEAGAALYARQLNLEPPTGDRIYNKGGTVWILGLKTERDATVLRTARGGKSEVLGAFIYTNLASDPNKVMFVSEEGSDVSFTLGEQVGRNQPFSPVRETRDGVTKILKNGDVPYRVGRGSLITLYTGYRPKANKAPTGTIQLNGRAERYNQIKLTWDTRVQHEDSYTIQRKVGDGEFLPYDVVEKNTKAYNDSSLTAATTYSYRVRATNALGQTPWSNELTITTSNLPPPPVAPTNLLAQVSPQQNVAVTWTDNATDETGFYLERKAPGEADFRLVAQLGPNATSYTDVFTLPNSTYDYRVRVYYEVVASAYTNTATVTTGAGRGPLLRWRLDETAGTLASDATPNNNNGTVLGTSFEVAGGAGKLVRGIKVDGVDDAVRLDSTLITGYPFSFSLWLRLPASPAPRGTALFFGDRDRFDVYYSISAGPSGSFNLNSRYVLGSVAVNSGPNGLGQWHLVTAVFEGPRSRKFFINGTQRAVQTDSIPFSAGIDRFAVGRQERLVPADPFNGLIDDVRLYDRILSADEVRRLASDTTAGARLAAMPTVETPFTVSVSPNPAVDGLTVTVGGAAGEPLHLRLTDVQGRTLLEKQVQATTNQHQERLNVGNRTASLYLLQVSTPRGVITKKILKE